MKFSKTATFFTAISTATAAPIFINASTSFNSIELLAKPELGDIKPCSTHNISTPEHELVSSEWDNLVNSIAMHLEHSYNISGALLDLDNLNLQDKYATELKIKQQLPEITELDSQQITRAISLRIVEKYKAAVRAGDADMIHLDDPVPVLGNMKVSKNKAVTISFGDKKVIASIPNSPVPVPVKQKHPKPVNDKLEFEDYDNYKSEKDTISSIERKQQIAKSLKNLFRFDKNKGKSIDDLGTTPVPPVAPIEMKYPRPIYDMLKFEDELN